MKELRLYMQHLDLYAVKVYVGTVALILSVKYIFLNYLFVAFGFIYTIWADELKSFIGLAASLLTLLVVVYTNRKTLPNALKWFVRLLYRKKK